MSPVPARATLVELPSRANSIARRPTNGSTPAPPIPPAVTVQQKPPQPIEPSIKKEKTKSRVWGLLGIKPKKSRDLASQMVVAQSDVPNVRAAHKIDTLTPSRCESTKIHRADSQCHLESHRSVPSSRRLSSSRALRSNLPDHLLPPFI